MITFDPQLLSLLNQDETFVFLHICKRLGKGKTAFPSNDLLREETGKGINKIKRIITELQHKGVMEATQTMLAKGKFGPRILKISTSLVRVYNSISNTESAVLTSSKDRSTDSVTTETVSTKPVPFSKEVISLKINKEEERTHSKFDKEKVFNRCLELQKAHQIEGELDIEKIVVLCNEKLTLTDSFLLGGMQHFGFKYFKSKPLTAKTTGEKHPEKNQDTIPKEEKTNTTVQPAMNVHRFVSQKSGKIIGEWLTTISQKARHNTERLLQYYFNMLQESNLYKSINHLENSLYKAFDGLLVKLNNTKNIGCLNKALREAVRQKEPFIDRLL